MNALSRDFRDVRSLVEDKNVLSMSIEEMQHDVGSYRRSLFSRLDISDVDDFSRALVLVDYLSRIVLDDDVRESLLSEVSRSLPCFDGNDLEAHYRLVVDRLFDVVSRFELSSKQKEIKRIDARIPIVERMEDRKREECIKREDRRVKRVAASLEAARIREVEKNEALESRRLLENDPLEMSKFVLSLNGIDFSNYDFFVGSVRGRRGTHVALECRDECGPHYFVYPKDKQFRVVSKSQIDYYKKYRC